MSLPHIVDRLENLAAVAGNRRAGRIGWAGIVVEGNIEPDIGSREDQNRAVGKLPQAVYTALAKMIHNPHLVNRHKWLVEEHKESHSIGKSVSSHSTNINGRTHICARTLAYRTVLCAIHRRVATRAITGRCLFSLSGFVFC